MRERVKKILKDKKISTPPLIGTFHSTCVKILRKEVHLLGYSRGFAIYDENDQIFLIRNVMKELGIDLKKFNPRAILGKISNLKNELVTPVGHSKMHLEFFDKIVNKVYIEYQKQLKQNQALDFDDLLFLTVSLFKKHPEILKYYQDKFKYILVDEFQDTNKANYLFTHLLAKKYKNIFIVGDDAQGIYGWRGGRY